MGAGRIAVVVAAGVGDQPRSDAAERVANGLSRFAGYQAPVQHQEWFEVPDDAIQPVDRFETGHGNAEVDIYEFWWADQSRFPAASRSFLAAFVGLFLALPSLGRTALRTGDEIGFEPQPPLPGGWKKHLDYHLLGFLSWLVAVPVVVLTAMLLTTVATLAIAIVLPEASISGSIGVGLFGVGLSAFGLTLLRKYQNESGRLGAFWLGLIALTGATALCVQRLFEHGIEGKGIELALADTVAVYVAYPLRILWLAVLAMAVVVTIVLAAKLVDNVRHPDGLAVKRTVTAMITVGFGPFGLAVLMAMLGAMVGGIAQKVSPTVVWTPEVAGAAATGTPWCLPHPDSWTLIRCPTVSAWSFGTLMLSDAIFAMACAFAVVVAVILIYALAVGAGIARGLIAPPQGQTATSRQAARISLALRTMGGRTAAAALLVAAIVASYAAAAAWLPFLPLPRGVDAQAGKGVKDGAVQAGWAPVIAAIMGGIATSLAVAARVMGITPQSLAENGAASRVLRTVLDKPYDISTFLREPMGTARLRLMHLPEQPRQKMLRRYRALLRHVVARGYDRIVFVAHSQGTVLTVTMLHEPDLRLGESVSLMTFGCPLRQLYSERFPSQYAWVKDPAKARAFVKPVNGQWINLGTAGDPVGRTVFADVPSLWREGDSTPSPGTPYLEDLYLGKGGHSTYWTSPTLYVRLADLIERPG